mgnify:CR=1 FL=1
MLEDVERLHRLLLAADADINAEDAEGLTPLDLANLDKIGLLTVPSPLTGEDAANAFFGPYIEKYGYISPTTGQKTGGGLVGYGTLFDNDDFFRDAGQVGLHVLESVPVP